MIRPNRLGAAVFLFAILFAGSLEAQTRLNFPRLMSPQELTTTGFALVNTSPSTVTATLNLFGADGLLVTSGTAQVPARGQLARLGPEILTGISAGGWVQVTSPGSELQGFEIVGDFASLVDGAGPAPESTELALIHFSKDDIIHVANPSAQAAAVSLIFSSPAGDILGMRSVQLASFQAASLRIGDVTSDSSTDLVSLSSTVAISASITTTLPGGLDIAVTNAVPVSGAPSDLYFPFVPSGPQGASRWTTLLGVSNLSAASQTISLTFMPDAGSPVVVQRVLAPKASVGDSVTNLFSLPAGVFSAGWIRASGSGPLTGVAAYQDAGSGALATVPSQSTGSTRFFFGHIANISPWYTGLALLNNTATAANVEVSAIDQSGALIGSPATFSLTAGTRRSVVLSELAPQVLQRASDGGFVFVRTTNGVPLLGFELFGHSILPVLANVQGFALAPTSTFTPPPPLAGANPVTIDSITTTDGTNLKAQFRPLDSIAYTVTLSNTSASAVTGRLKYEVKDSRGQLLIAPAAPAVLTAGSNRFSYPSFIPSNALTGGYTVAASFESQSPTVVKSAAFDVIGGSTTPTLTLESPVPLSTQNVLTLAFRSGDTARFALSASNFTSQAGNLSVSYRLTGPGGFNGGTGVTNLAAGVGLSSTTVDVVIPAAAPLGVYAFVATTTVGGVSVSKAGPVTIGPRSVSETAALELAYVSGSDGIPRTSVVPGAVVLLNVSRLSYFITTQPATMRYKVTDNSSGTEVLNQPLAINLASGRSNAFVPFSAGAAAASYTFEATLTYEDNASVPRTSTLSVPFNIGANAFPAPSISTREGHVEDIDFVARTSFSPGDSFFPVRVIYSTFSAPVSGTVRYQIGGVAGPLLDQTLAATFSPGLNISSLGIRTAASIPSGGYTFVMTATVQGQSSANTVNFAFAGPIAPSLNPILTDSTSGLFETRIEPFTAPD